MDSVDVIPITAYYTPSVIRTSDGYYRFMQDTGLGSVEMYISLDGFTWTDPIDVGYAGAYGPCLDVGSDDVIWASRIQNSVMKIYKGTPNKGVVPYTYSFAETTLAATPNEYYGNCAVAKFDPNYIVMSFRSKWWISRDGGTNWTLLVVGSSDWHLAAPVWIDSDTIIAAVYNYISHDLHVYTVAWGGASWTATDSVTIATIGYNAWSDIDYDSDGNIYILYSKAGVKTVWKAMYNDLGTSTEYSFTTTSDFYDWGAGILQQRGDGEFLILTRDADLKLNAYHTADKFATIVDLGIKINCGVNTSYPQGMRGPTDVEPIVIVLPETGSKSLIWVRKALSILPSGILVSEIVEDSTATENSISCVGQLITKYATEDSTLTKPMGFESGQEVKSKYITEYYEA
jgi:hypothetical protein